MALTGNTNEEKIWNYFVQKDKIGNAYGVAGLMGNIKRESNFNPKNMENSYESKLGFTDETYVQAVDNNTYHNFQTDRCGFGICQHTSPDRKTNMWIRSKETNKSIGDLEFQLDFIMWEFNNGYKAVLNTLKNATSVKEASDYVCTKYERPANQSASALKSRSDAGEEIYEKFYKKENAKEEKKMGYVFKTNLANKSNYGSARSLSKIQWLVIHYTANDGDTDENNGKYFANNVVKASAHYFVDDDSVTQSVPDNYAAWAVGDARWSNYKTTGGAKYYGTVNNTNSLSIEICDDVKNGVIYPSAKTIENALTLAKEKMKQYNIPQERVIRHFDVSGKNCPAYWCGTAQKDAKWKTEFWNKLSGIVNSQPNTNTSTTPAKTYTVVSGDTLSKIGSKTGVNWKTIADLNGIKFPYIIKKGQVLKLSEGVTIAQTTTKPTPTTSTTTSTTVPLKITQSKKEIQKFLNTYYGTEIKKVVGALLSVDGDIGNKSKLALGVAIQVELNKLGAGLDIDGKIGSKSATAWNKYVGTLKSGSRGIFVTLWQCILVGHNYDPSGIDGSFGNGCKDATNKLFAKIGLTKDSSVSGSDINALL